MYEAGQKVLIEAEIVSDWPNSTIVEINEAISESPHKIRVDYSSIKPMPPEVEPFDPEMIKISDKVSVRVKVWEVQRDHGDFQSILVRCSGGTVVCFDKSDIIGFAPPLLIPDPKTAAEYDSLTVAERERFWAAKAKGGA